MHIEKAQLSDGMRYIVHHNGMNSLLEIVDEFERKWKEENEPKGQDYRDNRGSLAELDDNWTHGRLKSYENTQRCLRYSEVPDFVSKKAEAFRQALMASETYRTASERAASTKRRRVYELEGGELDIDRYLGGQDECWSKVTRGLQRPVVRLGVSLMTHAGNNEEAFAGVAALGTCCALLAEQAGCSLEIVAVTFTQGGGMGADTGAKEIGMILPVKKPNEPFHQDSMLICGIPGYFRFYCVHRAALGLSKGNGHGGASTMSKELKEHLGLQHLLECAWGEGQQKVFLDEFVKTLVDA